MPVAVPRRRRFHSKPVFRARPGTAAAERRPGSGHEPAPGKRHPLRYFACPAIWPMRKMTNSAGFTGAMPISQTICPASTTSGGFVSESHLT